MAQQRKRRLDRPEIEDQLESLSTTAINEIMSTTMQFYDATKIVFGFYLTGENESQSQDPILSADDVEDVLRPFDDLENYANCSDVSAESGDEDEDKSVADDASDHNDDVQRELGLEEPNRKKSKRGGRLKDGICSEFEKAASTTIHGSASNVTKLSDVPKLIDYLSILLSTVM
jgi:hypothetical protein